MVMLTWPKWRDGIYENGSTGTFPYLLILTLSLSSSLQLSSLQTAMKTTCALLITVFIKLGTAITVDTKLGQIEGVSTSNAIHQFLNIPYAEPPGTPCYVSSFKFLPFDCRLITTTVSTQLMICDGEHQNRWQPLHGKARMMVQNGETRAISHRGW